jgi:hypothetical protein
VTTVAIGWPNPTVSSAAGPWTFTVASVSTDLAGATGRLNPNAVEDTLLILHYRS